MSVLAHVALLFLPLPDPRLDSEPPGVPTIRVDLVDIDHQEHRPSDRPEERTERQEPITEDPPAAHDTAKAVSTTAQSAPVEPAKPSDTAPATAGRIPPDQIRTQLLDTARELGRESEQTGETNGLDYSKMPALPSRTGWLNQYTGRVEASADHWRENDGSANARIVTGSGQVVCVRTRAPTITETFNPWMSSAVPMVHGCGRERPEAPDPNDAWIRRPGGDGE